MIEITRDGHRVYGDLLRVPEEIFAHAITIVQTHIESQKGLIYSQVFWDMAQELFEAHQWEKLEMPKGDHNIISHEYTRTVILAAIRDVRGTEYPQYIHK